jgi:predicted AAA+ superfamily ATPase
LVILDEIQRLPEIFKTLRGIIDKRRRDGNGNGQFLILGSASIDLLKQSSESLAGRISYFELGVLNILEVDGELDKLWLRGGLPLSFTATTDATSSKWREDFIRTFLERDVPQFGPRIPATTLRRLWTMVAHLHGTIMNSSTLASSLDISSSTASRYIDLLCDLLLVRKLQPYYANTKKRLVKTPKIYIRDSGLLHSLLNIPNLDSLLSYPLAGASWEGFVIENILSVAPSYVRPYFYRTSGGAEIDLVLELEFNEVWAIEIKRSTSPKVSKGFYEGCEDVRATKRFIVYNGTETFQQSNNVVAIGLSSLMTVLQNQTQ